MMNIQNKHAKAALVSGVGGLLIGQNPQIGLMMAVWGGATSYLSEKF